MISGQAALQGKSWIVPKTVSLGGGLYDDYELGQVHLSTNE